MIVFELQTHRTRYCSFALVNSRDAAIYDAFNGESLVASWRPVTITAADEEDAEAELGDYALLGVVPVFSWRAVEAMGDLLRPNGELLPLRYHRGDYVAYNVTRIIDALDEEASSILRFRDGKVMAIQEYIFRPDRLVGATIFKIPQLPKAFVFVTGEFARRVEDSALTGFHFRKLWGDRQASTA
jgi:hypothetical protein